MNIVHIICSLNTGGAELLLIDLARCQSELGHTVSIIIVNDSYERALIDSIDPRVKVRLVHRPEGSRNPLYILKLYASIRRLHPDVIHFHNDSAAKIAPLFKKTIRVGTIHCPGINIQNYTKLDAIISISQAVADDLEARQGISSDVIINGIDFDAINSNPLPYSENKTFRIVQTGRMRCSIKGQDIMTKATAILTKRGYNVSVDLIGEPNDRDVIHELATELSVTDCVHILGRKSREYVYKNLCTYHLGVMPSRLEGFGLSLIEYMAAKIPIVATNVDGPAEILQSNRYGLLCKPEDPEDLAHAIVKVINNYAQFSAIAQNCAYAYAYKNFSIENTAINYIQKYESLIIEKKHNK